MRSRSNSKTIVHGRILGHPFGIYSWSRNYNRVGGLVFRIGPLGHVQLQHYRGMLVGKQAEGRRGKHGVKISIWGTSGRRRKRTLELNVHL